MALLVIAREAFKAVFSFQQTLDGLNAAEVPNLDKAKANVEELMREILTRLSAQESRGHLQGTEDNDLAGVA